MHFRQKLSKSLRMEYQRRFHGSSSLLASCLVRILCPFYWNNLSQLYQNLTLVSGLLLNVIHQSKELFSLSTLYLHIHFLLFLLFGVITFSLSFVSVKLCKLNSFFSNQGLHSLTIQTDPVQGEFVAFEHWTTCQHLAF